MTSTTAAQNHKLIHIGRMLGRNGHFQYVFLRKTGPHSFVWFEEAENGKETESSVAALNPEEAMRLAVRHWKDLYFNTLMCGFRYNLPERDEHGINALFHQMVASYSSMNGVYYDEELGNNCYVQNASEEAYQLWQRLKSQQRL
jgi:hypothetical protein